MLDCLGFTFVILQASPFEFLLSNENECFVTVADVFLWRDKKLSGGILGGATVMWFLFEFLECHLLTLVAHSLIVGIGALFLWSNALAFINKYVTDFFLFFSFRCDSLNFLRLE